MAYKETIKKYIPPQIYRPILNLLRKPKPVHWGGFRKLQPISRKFGFDRGQPIDRYYIEDFIGDNSSDIKGHVLEIGDPTYSNKFGSSAITKIDVFHAVEGNPSATIVGDFVTGSGLVDSTFDCLIITQTYHLIYDIRSALSHTYKSLKPGGVLLATFPGIAQISRYDMDRWGDYWRFTDLSARMLIKEIFPENSFSIYAYGNVLSATAFLQGLASHELTKRELDYRDQDYPVIIAIRAVRPISV